MTIPTAASSVRLTVRMDNVPGVVERVVPAVAAAARAAGTVR